MMIVSIFDNFYFLEDENVLSNGIIVNDLVGKFKSWIITYE